MSAIRNLEAEILELRGQKKSYRDIQKILQCSKKTINYHCEKAGLTDVGQKKYPLTLEKKIEIFEFCKTHSNIEAKEQLNVSISSVIKYKDGGFLKDLESTE
jgi:DNA-binding CsgD family transcriptional regulator